MLNRLSLSGRVGRKLETRITPGGVPLTRFTLAHRSQQLEDGLPVLTVLNILVVAAGKTLSEAAEHLQEGQAVVVEGFLNRAKLRERQSRLVLHAQEINADLDAP